MTKLPESPEIDTLHKYSAFRIVGFFVSVFSIAAIIFFIFWLSTQPPRDFPQNSSITIEQGTSVAAIVDIFQEQGYVKSSSILLAYIRLYYNEDNIKAGKYFFDEPLTIAEVADHIVNVGPQDELVSLTFPEGSTVEQFASIADAQLPNFDSQNFLIHAEQYEGYLLPETYFVPDQYTDVQLLSLLRLSHNKQIELLQERISTHPLSKEEIIVLASIIEREANTPESMRLVSGILQNRLEINMPLQADASIEYILDTPLSELPPGKLAAELRKTDSPYNTYLYTGLPPTPIGNPGLQAIEAVLNPTASEYFYYLTDSDGIFHYARTLSEHNQNIARYLR